MRYPVLDLNLIRNRNAKVHFDFERTVVPCSSLHLDMSDWTNLLPQT